MAIQLAKSYWFLSRAACYTHIHAVSSFWSLMHRLGGEVGVRNRYPFAQTISLIVISIILLLIKTATSATFAVMIKAQAAFMRVKKQENFVLTNKNSLLVAHNYPQHVQYIWSCCECCVLSQLFAIVFCR